MKLKRLTSMALSVIMLISSLNVCMAETSVNYCGTGRDELVSGAGAEIDAAAEIYLLASSNDTAYPVEGGNIYYDPNTGKITGCDESVTSAVIPSVINETEIVSIGEYAFYNCSSMVSVTIPDSVASIGGWAFKNCSSLTEITIPSGVTVISSCMFDSCSALTSVVIPEGVTGIGSSAFDGCKGLTDVKIPSSVTGIGNYAFRYCSSLTEITIPSGVTSIGSYAFYYCSALTGITVPSSVASIGSYAFDGCSNSLTMYVVEFSYAEEYATAEGINYEYSVQTDKQVEYALTIKNAEGSVIDDGYTVNWFDGDKYIASGSKIIYVQSENVYYDIYLNGELGFKYYKPERQKAEGNVGALSYVLTEIPYVSISGTVADEDGLPVADADVVISQSANGYTKKDTVKTASDGSFSASVCNTDATITVKKDLYYNSVYVLISGDNIKEAYDEARIIMKKLPANKITLNVTAVKTTVAEGSITSAYADTSELEFSLFNKTQDCDITNFSLQYPYILLSDNAAKTGDVIAITVKDKNNRHVSEEVFVTLDKTRNGSADIRLVENGYFTMNTLSGDEKLVLVFNENGELVWKTVSKGAAVVSDNLPEGAYKAVVMKKTTLISNVANISALNAMGLGAGSDYAVKSLTISAGAITDLGEVKIPALDEAKLYYTDTKNTSIYLSKSKTAVGLLTQVTAKYKFKDSFDGTVTGLTVNLPDNVDFVEKSLAVKGGEAAYSLNNKTLNIFTDKAEGTVKFYVMCTSEGEFNIEGYINISSTDGDALQPIGSCSATAEPLKINIPEKTGRTEINAFGTVYPSSTLTLYVDGVKAAQTTANSAGSWAVGVALGKSYIRQSHEIYGEVTNQFGTVTTETAKVVYYPDAVNLDTITVRSDVDVKVLDFNGSSTRLESYSIHKSGSISYEVKFYETAQERLKNVYVVTVNSSNDKTYIPCIYNAANDSWIGGYDYESNANLPVAVTAAYKAAETEEIVDMFDTEMINQFSNDYDKLKDAFNNELNKRIEVLDVVDVSDTGFSVTLGIKDDNDNVSDFGKLVYEIADISEFNLSNWEDLSYAEFTNTNGGAMYVLNNANIEADTGAMCCEYVIPEDGLYLKVRLDVSANEESLQALDSVVASVLTELLGLLSSSAKSVVDDVSYSAKANDFTDELHRQNAVNYELIMEFCENTGEPRLSADNKLKYLYTYDQTTDEIFAYREECEAQIREWALMGCLGDIAGKGLSEINVVNKAADLTKKLSTTISKALPAKGQKVFDAALNGITKVEEFINERIQSVALKVPEGPFENVDFSKMTNDALDEMAGNYLSDAATEGVGSICDTISKMDAMYYIENKYKDINQSINNTRANILKDQITCDEKPEDSDEAEPQKPLLTNTNPFKPITPILDPSGYVYEAVPSNRLENVKTTLYYLGDAIDEFGMPTGEKTPVLWNAEDYDQSNPLFTDAQGDYMWDVPEGSWQVKYEKEGYGTEYSQWLPVPPPQLDVNQALVSTQAPEVLSVNVYNDEVEVIFSKYMRLSSADKIKVMLGDKSVEGETTAANAEFNAENTEMYATIFKFKPDENISGDVTVTVESAEGYNMLTSQSYTVTKTAVIRPVYIDAPDSVNIEFGSTAIINAQIMPKAAATGLTVVARVLSEDIAPVAQKAVAVDENGAAAFTVSGALLGQTEIELTIPGTAISKTVTVNVSKVSIQSLSCQKVSASIPSGSIVEKGETVTLSTSTQGADIYYTLDKTCPCVVDSPSRIKYTEPITVNEDMYIIAYAVKDGYEDSATASFIYTVNTPFVYGDADGSGILTSNDASTVLYKIMNEDFVMNIETKTDNYMQYVDVDNNKTITTADAAAILQKVLDSDYVMLCEEQ